MAGPVITICDGYKVEQSNSQSHAPSHLVPLSQVRCSEGPCVVMMSELPSSVRASVSENVIGRLCLRTTKAPRFIGSCACWTQNTLPSKRLGNRRLPEAMERRNERDPIARH